ncbi:MAG: sulfatase-like hydrolase/transferase [Planctomycetaceae bacterium]
MPVTRLAATLLVSLLALFVLTGKPAAGAGEGPRPNILFLLTDDQAPWALGLAGHPHAVTPQLDRLFQSGAYLPNSFTVTPVCSPSRASLMTSRYGSELGITDWIHPKNEPDLGLDPATPVWPILLQAAGYQTALFGKWHLGTQDRFHPTEFGFDEFLGMREGGASPRNPTLEVNGQMQKVHGFPPDIFTDEAIRWLRLRDPKASPFCLCVHYREPHAAWLPVRDEDWEPFASLDPQVPNPDVPNLDVERVKKMTREYLASLHSVDRNVGNILDELERLDLADNTIVIYTSDHGYNMGHNGIWHKGNGHWVVTDPPRPPRTSHVVSGPTCTITRFVSPPRSVGPASLNPAPSSKPPFPTSIGFPPSATCVESTSRLTRRFTAAVSSRSCGDDGRLGQRPLRRVQHPSSVPHRHAGVAYSRMEADSRLRERRP